ncbi:hypothetical protein EKE94_02130 [Mesobaculum littorinae]|uniref:Uncharacterized protein n=2 Tax=Mesobaculum littorinae TaxID=2486419 RepID=A0A438AN09_9RHOB|nr:hypothetical protein EKE94_02130 [Mesobaculum littorinae]
MARAAAAITCATVLAATPALAGFQAENALYVEPAGNTSFDVPYRGGRAGASDFWCAAGDYVIRGLNAAPGTRIWRVSEPPRRSGQGIRFSLSPDGAASRSGLLTLFGQGDASLSAAHARALCEASRDR